MNMGDPWPDMVIAGYALIFGDLVDPAVLAGLRRAGEAPDGIWAALFIYDRNPDGSWARWTVWTADRDYALLLATRAERAELPRLITPDTFPVFQAGWVIGDDPDQAGD